MTRDEAIKIVAGKYSLDSAVVVTPPQFVDLCAKLGMLKLEEPKSATAKAEEVIAKYGKDHGHLVIGDAINIIDRLDNAGLKIVEK